LQPPSATPFDLLLFSTDVTTISAAVAGGASAVVIDWEAAGKHQRQAGADTQIGSDTLDDLIRVRRGTTAKVICRTDRFGEVTHGQIDAAARFGADEVLLPMVTGPEEVEAALDYAAARVGVGILIETESAVRCVAELSRLPLTRVYVGLNDLSIQRRSACLFDALVDGTVERLRGHFSVPFGFAGLTRPGRGFPVPVELLMSEMVRLDCAFSFLRRSFHRDIAGESGKDVTAEILAALKAFRRHNSGPALVANQEALARVVDQWRERPPMAARSQAS
jgi:hypothetical protein